MVAPVAQKPFCFARKPCVGKCYFHSSSESAAFLHRFIWLCFAFMLAAINSTVPDLFIFSPGEKK
ncbi:hypothetical protein UYSO10_5798 [Kosakonia radicincitans]|nr:hypothetical protein UYSO10_5798 [Kosakonia radicincitans]